MPTAASEREAHWSPIFLGRLLANGAVRRVLLDGRDLVVWRSYDGRPSLWDNRCPHRGMRLSYGFVRGDALACIYHGWQYGQDGICRRIPAHPDLEPPKSITVNTYRCVETAGVIWGALATEASNPPDIGGFGLRSLAVEAPREALENAICDAGGRNLDTHLNMPVKGAGELTVLVQPMTAGRSAMHLLCDREPAADALLAMSRKAEALRCQAEAACSTERRQG